MNKLHRYNEKTGRKEFYIEVEGYKVDIGHPQDLVIGAINAQDLHHILNKEWLEFDNTVIRKIYIG